MMLRTRACSSYHMGIRHEGLCRWATDGRRISFANRLETSWSMTQMKRSLSKRLADASPDLEHILTRGSVEAKSPIRFAEGDIRRQTIWMRTRDGVRLATDLYQPPILPAPSVVLRTPYGRASEHYVRAALSF